MADTSGGREFVSSSAEPRRNPQRRKRRGIGGCIYCQEGARCARRKDGSESNDLIGCRTEARARGQGRRDRVRQWRCECTRASPGSAGSSRRGECCCSQKRKYRSARQASRSTIGWNREFREPRASAVVFPEHGCYRGSQRRPKEDFSGHSRRGAGGCGHCDRMAALGKKAAGGQQHDAGSDYSCSDRTGASQRSARACDHNAFGVRIAARQPASYGGGKAKRCNR